VLVTIPHALNVRASLLQNFMEQNLMKKRDQLIEQVQRVDSRNSEFLSVAGQVEDEILMEIQRVLDRLHRYVRGKLHLLGQDTARLKSDVQAIDDIVSQVNQSRSAGPFAFLTMYPSLAMQFEELFKRPVPRTSVDQPNECSHEDLMRIRDFSIVDPNALEKTERFLRLREQVAEALESVKSGTS